MIEFLVPRDGAFGESGTADFVGFDGADDAAFGDEPPRSRWSTVVAVLGVTGLLAGGVIAAAPWDADEVSAPPTTIPASATSAPSAPTTDAPASERRLPAGTITTPAGWMLDEPGRFVPASAGSNGAFVGPGDAFHLWRDELASRTTGAFVAIDSQAMQGDIATLREDGVAIGAGDRRALLWEAPDGVIELQVDTPTGRFTITSGGVGLDRLVGLAAAITLDPSDRNTFDYHGLDGPDGPLAGLGLAIDRSMEISPGVGQVGTALAWTSYFDPRRQQSVELRLLATSVDEQQINDLVLSRPLPEDAYGPGDAATVERLARARRPVQVRIATSGSDQLIGRMRLGDGTQLVAVGDLDVSDLLDVLGRVRPATDDEWRSLVLDSRNGFVITDDDPPTPLILEPTGSSWSAAIDGERFFVTGQDFWILMPFTHGSGPELREYRTIDQRFLRATTTFPDEARSIIVIQPGLDPVTLDLVEVDRSAVFAAMIELDPDLPSTVQWLDADGAPVPGPTAALP